MKRIHHPWDLWECHKAGFYDSAPPQGMEQEDAFKAYATFLRDTPRFEAALERVLREWPFSCEQFLSNESLNRVAWLGQASMCIATGVPACFRAGFKQLSPQEQTTANATAQRALDRWIEERKNAPEDSKIHHGLDEARIPEWNPEPSAAAVDDAVPSAVLQSDLFRNPA